MDSYIVKNGINTIDDDIIPLALLISVRDSALKILCKDTIGCELSNYEILNIDFGKIEDNEYKKNYILKLTEYLEKLESPLFLDKIYNKFSNLIGYLFDRRNIAAVLLIFYLLNYKADLKTQDEYNKLEEHHAKTQDEYNKLEEHHANEMKRGSDIVEKLSKYVNWVYVPLYLINEVNEQRK